MPRRGLRGPRGYKRKASVLSAIEKARRQGRPVTTRDVQPGRGKDKMVGRGGARLGSGPKSAPTVPWAVIRKHAEAGAPLDDIIKGTKSLKLEWIEDPATYDEIKKTVEEGNATYRLKLREAVAKKGLGVATGSASTLALAARNELGFDQQGPGVDDAPDLASVDAQLGELLDKLAKKVGNAR